MAAKTVNEQRDTMIRTSTEAAQEFVEVFYQALSDGKSISSFYVTDPKFAERNPDLPLELVVNGTKLSTTTDYKALLETQRTTVAGTKTRVAYEPTCVDVHVLNPSFVTASSAAANGTNGSAPAKPQPQDRSGRRASLMVNVTGTLSLGAGKEAPKVLFSDVLVLAPRWGNMGGGRTSNHAPKGRSWLIMSQNFRALS